VLERSLELAFWIFCEREQLRDVAASGDWPLETLAPFNVRDLG
jgi:hypothetical protein